MKNVKRQNDLKRAKGFKELTVDEKNKVSGGVAKSFINKFWVQVVYDIYSPWQE